MSVLEFISSLKWPVVVLVALAVVSWGFKRNPDMGAWFRWWLDGRDVRGKFGAAEIEATASRAVEALQAAAASDGELEGAVAELRASGDAPASEDGSVGQTVSAIRRDAVERLMRDAAQWGWEMGQLGIPEPPELDVVWKSDGSPIVRYGMDSLISRTVVTQPGGSAEGTAWRGRRLLPEFVRREHEERQSSPPQRED